MTFHIQNQLHRNIRMLVEHVSHWKLLTGIKHVNIVVASILVKNALTKHTKQKVRCKHVM